MVVAEVHECNGQQSETRDGQGDDAPRHTHRVPLQGVERSQYHHDDNHWEEPLAVHHLLGIRPIAVYDVAIEEEGEVEQHLYERGVLQEIV